MSPEIHEIMAGKSHKAAGHPLSTMSSLLVVKVPEKLHGFLVVTFSFSVRSSLNNCTWTGQELGGELEVFG